MARLTSRPALAIYCHEPEFFIYHPGVKVFLITVLLFVAAMLLHVIWWRIALPKKQLPTLFRLFIIFFVTVVFLVQVAARYNACNWLAAPTWIDWLTVAFLYGSLAICYLITYPAIEAHSPTLSLMYALYRSGGKGMSHEDAASFLERFQFISARMGALIADGFLVNSDGLLKLPERNYFFFKAILVYRKVILGLRNSGG